MSKIQREWRVINEEPTEGVDMPIRQVYTWLLTSDRHVVIVSKDGKNWQLPGGKPDDNESATQAAVREVSEETNIDRYREDLNFFGEYVIQDDETHIHPPQYRQVRAWMKLPYDSSRLKLSTAGEAKCQRPEDAVRFVKTIPI